MYLSSADVDEASSGEAQLEEQPSGLRPLGSSASGSGSASGSSASGKKYRNAAALVDRGKRYPLNEALQLLQKISYSSFDGTVELVVNLGVDPRHADQNVRGVVSLPHGRGKEVRIVVFAGGEKVVEVGKLDVEAVGGPELVEKIQGGWLDFDQVVATPDMMGLVGRLGRILGPRGLMPNPKLGTVTADVSKAVKELKAGRVEYRVDKGGIIHVAVGKVSMAADLLMGNVQAVMEALVRSKPASAKGTYIKKVGISATMSPGIKVDPASAAG